MVSLASIVDIFESVYGLKAHNLFTHELFSADKAVAMRNLGDENWHLFGSNSFFIQTSVAKITHEIRHSNSNDDWNKNVNVLGGFHDYHYQ